MRSPRILAGALSLLASVVCAENANLLPGFLVYSEKASQGEKSPRLRVNLNDFDVNQGELRFFLPDNENIKIEKINSYTDNAGYHIWKGRSADPKQRASLTLVKKGPKLYGALQLKSRALRIHPTKIKGEHLMIESNFKNIRDCDQSYGELYEAK